MRFASVILDIPTAALDAPYTYAVPETADERARLAAKGHSAKKAAKKPAQASLDDLLGGMQGEQGGAASSELESPVAPQTI